MEKELPVYKLTIKEDIESGVEVDAVALVDVPAIGVNFYAFNEQEFESYTDYPKQASENAKVT